MPPFIDATIAADTLLIADACRRHYAACAIIAMISPLMPPCHAATLLLPRAA